MIGRHQTPFFFSMPPGWRIVCRHFSFFFFSLSSPYCCLIGYFVWQTKIIFLLSFAFDKENKKKRTNISFFWWKAVWVGFQLQVSFSQFCCRLFFLLLTIYVIDCSLDLCTFTVGVCHFLIEMTCRFEWAFTSMVSLWLMFQISFT